MKKFVYVCTVLLLLIFAISTLSACSANDYEEEERIMDLLTKSRYGDGMRFEFRIVIDEEARIWGGSVVSMILDPRIHFHNPFYTDIIFVHNEAEADALNLPDNIIVAWPRDAEWTEGLIAGIHWTANRSEGEIRQRLGLPLRDVVTLEEFGLSYPITIEDLVDNWEKVNALWNAFASGERERIQRFASAGGPPEANVDSADSGGDSE